MKPPKEKEIKHVMSWLGSKTSEAKKKAARLNGLKGGRPINPLSIRQKKLRGEA